MILENPGGSFVVGQLVSNEISSTPVAVFCFIVFVVIIVDFSFNIEETIYGGASL